MALVCGVDSSTQSTKVELRDVDTGAVVGAASAPHPPTEPPVSEQDPTSWWEALTSALGQVADHLGDVVAISVAGQQHGMVLVDEAGEVIRPAKLWNDTTSSPQADALVERLGAEGWARACGSVPVAAFTVTKLAWVAEHEPELVPRIAKAMLPHDYLTWRLSGEHVTDRGDASGSGWWDPTGGEYRPDLLALAVDDAEVALPRVLGPSESAGTVVADVGLPSTTVVGPGTGDNMGAALGLGLRAGDAVISLGTSGTAFAVSDTPTADPSGFVAGFADATGRYLPLVCTLNATKVTDAVQRWLGVGRDELVRLALAAEAGGPVLVPYLDGERTPNLPDATGVFVGLRTSTDQADLARAAHLGVVCGLLDGVDALVDAGVTLGGRRFLVGGGARSAAYRQLLADASGAPIVVPHTDETVAAGAAVQAAVVATGRSFDDVVEAWGLGAGDTVAPRRDADAATIRASYARARELATG
ncbi:MAG: xylulokinase [Actinomycetota bacterium]